MTVAHIYTVAFQGIEAREVDVQVHIGDSGGGQFNIVGLADKAVGESKERVRAALSAIGLALPYKRITVNLAPADLPKEGSHCDLPIALGLLAAMGVLPASEMENYVALGELSLDAAVTMVAGVLPAALAASEAGRGLICPVGNGQEAAWAGDMEILATPSLIVICPLPSGPGTDLPGSFCTKRIDRNWLGKELGHAEEKTDAGADSDTAEANRGGDVTG